MTADAERLAAIRDIIRRASGHVDGRGLRLDADELRRVLGEAFDCGAATVAAERDAEKERAKDFEVMLDGADAGFAIVAAERDALRARIEAAPHASDCLTSNKPVVGVQFCSCWKSTALAGDQPDATPEREAAGGAPCMECGGIPDAESGCTACNSAGSVEPWLEATPEPPYLDPYPWVSAMGKRYSAIGKIPGDKFHPRPADENGRPYSQDRADYGAQS